MIAFHFYETPPEATAYAMANVRLVMAKNGVSATPLWDTEGASGDSSVPEDLAAAYLVRKYLVDLAFGSIRYDWYAWGKATTFCVGTEENDPRVLTEAGRAFGLLLDWLRDASLTGASIDPAGTWQIALSWLHRSAHSGDSLSRGLIVWNPSTTVQFAIPSELQQDASRYDIFGNVSAVAGPTVMVGSSPVLLH
jgi:hypothetical protein